MKKLLMGLLVSLAVLFAGGGLVHAGVNDFKIRDFSVDYYLDKGSDGSSTLRTVEIIEAVFPSFDQNHGIERALPAMYDGHPTSLKIDSVTMKIGLSNIDAPYSTRWQGDSLILRIGDKDSYAHGTQTYRIEYSQRDVTKYFPDTNDDEFYWDTNGTGWLQHFDSVTATVHLGQSIVNSTTGSNACYYGVHGAKNKCQVTGSGDTITARQANLGAGENLTIVVGFKPGTFVSYQMTPARFIERYAAIISSLIGLVGIIAVAIIRAVKGKSAPGRGTIVAEYLPPPDVDVALASVISKRSGAWVSATIVDLAVRHKLRIIENDKKKFSIEFVTSDGTSDTEKQLVGAFFGDNPHPGDRYEINRWSKNVDLANKTMAIYKKVKSSADDAGYYMKNIRLQLMMSIIVSIVALQAFAVALIFNSSSTLFGDLMIIVSVTLLISGIVIVWSMKPLSVKGRELFDYLKGLKLYIKTAEEDRLRMLQSPEGAARSSIDANDNSAVLHLYERLLPYAVLFGQEKQWVKTLGRYYEQQSTQPDWYVGHSIFNAALFSSSLSSFSSNVSSNSSYSSSGGSGGGGFSGGGGGGGGGGGW